MKYTELKAEIIDRGLFAGFRRRQAVSKCWRKTCGSWSINDVVFTDDWDEEEYCELIAGLKNTAAKGGAVFGAFMNGELKGFASVEPALFGENSEYLDLSNIHVSEEMRGYGIGKMLFQLSKDWAKKHGAQKLYISAHSSVESQAFYRAMGCIEAHEYNMAHVEKEPYDCQMECQL